MFQPTELSELAAEHNGRWFQMESPGVSRSLGLTFGLTLGTKEAPGPDGVGAFAGFVLERRALDRPKNRSLGHAPGYEYRIVPATVGPDQLPLPAVAVDAGREGKIVWLRPVGSDGKVEKVPGRIEHADMQTARTWLLAQVEAKALPEGTYHPFTIHASVEAKLVTHGTLT